MIGACVALAEKKGPFALMKPSRVPDWLSFEESDKQTQSKPEPIPDASPNSSHDFPPP
jgi:hypothetical protein